MGCDSSILNFIILVAVILLFVWIVASINKRNKMREYAKMMAASRGDRIPTAQRVDADNEQFDAEGRPVRGNGEDSSPLTDF
jgi:hypothetical protein